MNATATIKANKSRSLIPREGARLAHQSEQVRGDDRRDDGHDE